MSRERLKGGNGVRVSERNYALNRTAVQHCSPTRTRFSLDREHSARIGAKASKKRAAPRRRTCMMNLINYSTDFCL